MGTLWKLLNIWSPQRIFLGDVPCAQLQHWIHVPCHPRKLPRCWRPDKKGHPERSVFRRSLQNKKKNGRIQLDSAGRWFLLVSLPASKSPQIYQVTAWHWARLAALSRTSATRVARASGSYRVHKGASGKDGETSQVNPIRNHHQ